MDFFERYSLNWLEPAGPSEVFLTTKAFPPGVNVYTTVALSRHRVDNDAVKSGRDCWAAAGIWAWDFFKNGETATHQPPSWVVQNAAFIENCATITYVLVVEGGAGTAQINIFTQ